MSSYEVFFTLIDTYTCCVIMETNFWALTDASNDNDHWKIFQSQDYFVIDEIEVFVDITPSTFYLAFTGNKSC